LHLNADGFATELRDLQEHELRRVAAEQQAELARLRDVARFD
jgi:ribosomal protein L29